MHQGGPLRGHVVAYPDALPSERWILSRLLWADSVGALWPQSKPDGSTEEQARSLKLIDRLADETGLFKPCHVRDDEDSVLQMVKEMRDKIPAAVSLRPHRADQPTPPHDHRLGGHRAHRPPPGEADFYYHYEKFAPRITEQLLDLRILVDDDHGFRAADKQTAEALLSVAVNFAEPADAPGATLIPEARSTTHLRLASTPAANEHPNIGVQALLPIPVLRRTTRALDNAADKVIALRLDPKTEQARRDYLDEIGSYWATESERLARDVALSQGRHKVRADMELAAASFLQRLRIKSVPNLAVAGVQGVLKIGAAVADGHVLGIASAVAGAAIDVRQQLELTPKGNTFLRSIHRQGLVDRVIKES